MKGKIFFCHQSNSKKSCSFCSIHSFSPLNNMFCNNFFGLTKNHCGFFDWKKDSLFFPIEIHSQLIFSLKWNGTFYDLKWLVWWYSFIFVCVIERDWSYNFIQIFSPTFKLVKIQIFCFLFFWLNNNNNNILLSL